MYICIYMYVFIYIHVTIYIYKYIYIYIRWERFDLPPTRWSAKVLLGPKCGVLRDQMFTTSGLTVNCVRQLTFDETTEVHCVVAMLVSTPDNLIPPGISFDCSTRIRLASYSAQSGQTGNFRREKYAFRAIKVNTWRDEVALCSLASCRRQAVALNSP